MSRYVLLIGMREEERCWNPILILNFCFILLWGEKKEKSHPQWNSSQKTCRSYVRGQSYCRYHCDLWDFFECFPINSWGHKGDFLPLWLQKRPRNWDWNSKILKLTWFSVKCVISENTFFFSMFQFIWLQSEDNEIWITVSLRGAGDIIMWIAFGYLKSFETLIINHHGRK